MDNNYPVEEFIPQIEKFNISIVIGRSNEGTLLRRLAHCEIQFVKEEMPIGAYAWQEAEEEAGTGGIKERKKWRFVVDDGVPFTFRHRDFSVPLTTENEKVYKYGDRVIIGDFLIVSLADELRSAFIYVTPRELLPQAICEEFPAIPWFITEDQSPGDSKSYSPFEVDYSRFLPSTSPTDERKVTQTYALCSHRTDMLTIFAGIQRCERRALLEIGRWYTCQFNPRVTAVLTSIRPYAGESPLEMYVRTFKLDDESDKEETLVLIRDVIRIPEQILDHRLKTFTLISYHPLVHSVHFPNYCIFSNQEFVEVCMVRRQYRRGDLHSYWEVVAVGNGMCQEDGYLYWLPQLRDDLKPIISKLKGAFPFIKTLTELEADHYKNMLNMEYEEVNSARIKAFEDYHKVHEPPPRPSSADNANDIYIEDVDQILAHLALDDD